LSLVFKLSFKLPDGIPLV